MGLTVCHVAKLSTEQELRFRSNCYNVVNVQLLFRSYLNFKNYFFDLLWYCSYRHSLVSKLNAEVNMQRESAGNLSRNWIGANIQRLIHLLSRYVKPRHAFIMTCFLSLDSWLKSCQNVDEDFSYLFCKYKHWTEYTCGHSYEETKVALADMWLCSFLLTQVILS